LTSKAQIILPQHLATLVKSRILEKEYTLNMKTEKKRILDKDIDEIVI